ncbi:hypothetical protein [Bdellovibrio sp. HCB274]|uniref:hypothetical protein n=1 Tax=Bdellovibrio sp. HCB274 TaxID=3394361 RepID=UPI0039B47091
MNKTNAIWILGLVIVAVVAFNLGKRSVRCETKSAVDAAACGAPVPAFPGNLPPPPPPSEPNSSHQ